MSPTLCKNRTVVIVFIVVVIAITGNWEYAVSLGLHLVNPFSLEL